MGMTEQILEKIKSANNILVCGHIRPDGDCISSALAMRRLCEKLGKIADAVCDCEKTDQFGFMPDYPLFCNLRHTNYDLFISVDCATEKRLGCHIYRLQSAAHSIAIDHHPTNPRYCEINHIVPDASSTCAIIYELFEDTDLIDKDIATMLYTGLSTDTGHFMHSNTDAKVFGIAKELCKYGIDVAGINHGIYCDRTIPQIKLMSRALANISLHRDGTIAFMPISLEDLTSCSCKSDDTEGLIDYASSIRGVKVAISMCEQPGNVFRISFRSQEADVAAAAETFGGGGHRLAAGCILTGNRYDIMEKLLNAAGKQLDALK